MTAAPGLNFNARTAILLGLILLLGAALRRWEIGRSSLWLDEFLTVSLSSGHGLDYEDIQGQQLMKPAPDYVTLEHANSIASIWTESARDIHPPLFYVALRLWRLIVPDTDAWLRTLSALFSVAAIVMLFLAVSAAGGTTAGLWAALLMALAGPQIQYAQENRSYTLLLATLLGACAALLWIERFGFSWPRAISLGLCALAAAMTHYAALPLLALLFVYALIRLRGTALKGALAALVGAGMLYALVWGPFAYAQMPAFSSQIGFTNAATGAPRLSELRVLMLLPLRFFSTTEHQTTEIAYLGAVLYFLPLLLIRRRPELLFWWLWLAVGVGVVALSDLVRGGQALNLLRYTLAASPAAYALAAMMLAHRAGWMRHLVPMTLALSSLLALEGAYDPGKPEWRDMGQYIDAHFLPGDVLIIGNLGQERWPARSDLVALSYYAHTPLAAAVLDYPPSPQLRQRILSARRIWLFTDNISSGIEQVLPGGSLAESDFVPGVGTMMRVQLPPSDARPALPLPRPVDGPTALPNPPSTAPAPVAQR